MPVCKRASFKGTGSMPRILYMPGIFHGRANVPARAIERDICSLALPASHGPARGGEVAGNGRERTPHRHLLVRVSCSVSSSGTSLVLDPYAIGAKVAFWVLHAALLMLSKLGADGPDACATVLLWALYFWACPSPNPNPNPNQTTVFCPNCILLSIV